MAASCPQGDPPGPKHPLPLERPPCRHPQEVVRHGQQPQRLPATGKQTLSGHLRTTRQVCMWDGTVCEVCVCAQPRTRMHVCVYVCSSSHSTLKWQEQGHWADIRAPYSGFVWGGLVCVCV